jgi:aromatic-L-amino-acid decarboxylase
VKDETTLDPADWTAVRALGHKILDDMFTRLETLRERPVWQPIPDNVKAGIRQPVPRTGVGAGASYRAAQELVIPYSWGNPHPRFWGWVNGSGSAGGVLAEMIAATMNVNASLGQQSAILIELQVIDWCKELMGFPADASGLLVTGGSVANLLGLAVARDATGSIPADGLRSQSAQRAMYCSEQTHNSVDKSVALLGLGRSALRKIPVDRNFRIEVGELRTRIQRDRKAGIVPTCIIANAGTVNTGAIDPLDELADLCATEDIWLHVDGAFGAVAALAPELKSLLKGMERADSLAFDLHKWLHVPYDAGCILIRDRSAHQNASFAAVASYLAPLERGPATGPADFSQLGPELSRGFRSFKVWMSFMEHGVDMFGRLARQNVEQARHLVSLIEQAPDLELLAPAPLNVVCFRFTLPGRGDEALNVLNRELLLRLQESGIAVPSATVLNGRFAIRCAITNHRTRRADLEMLVDAVRQIGSTLPLLG